jgi:type IV secretory pathway TraG/TraD family ATPase VirD4
MYDHLLHLITRFLQKFRITLTCTYIWELNQNRFVLISNRKYVRRNHRITYVIYGNMVVVAWNVLQTSQKEVNPLFQMISLGMGAVTVFVTVNRWKHHKGAAAIVQFLNCMVEFERSSTQRGNI